MDLHAMGYSKASLCGFLIIMTGVLGFASAANPNEGPPLVHRDPVPQSGVSKPTYIPPKKGGRRLMNSIFTDESKILIIGGTGHIGKFIVQASAKDGHPTFAFVRESTVKNPAKSNIIDSFKSCGVKLIHGDINDHESLLKAIKQVDVVISTVGPELLADQVNIIDAIKEAGTVKRFLPSEFGSDVDRSRRIEPAARVVETKAKIRRAIEAEGIPFTYVISNGFFGAFLPNLGTGPATVPPRDKVIIIGDGNTKSIFVGEEDIATYTIKAVDDPRTLNKSLYMRLPANILSLNEIVSLWEKKISKTLKRTYILEDQILKRFQGQGSQEFLQEDPLPENYMLSLCHSYYVQGNATNYEIEASFGVEASELYPDVKYTTVDEYFNQFV